MHFKDWEIVNDDLLTLDDMNDSTLLTEDLFQARLGGYVIDCGWYEAEGIGSFVTYLIKEGQWEEPLTRIVTDNLADAVESLNTCVAYYNKEVGGAIVP